MDIDPNTLSVLLGVLSSGLTSLIALSGKEVGKHLIGKENLQKWEQEKTALQPLLHRAVCCVADEAGWTETRGEEIVALFLRTPEVEEIVRQIYSTHIVHNGNENKANIQLLGEIFAKLFVDFIAAYPLDVILNFSKSGRTIASVSYLFEALLEGCHLALHSAVDQGVLAGHEALSAFRHNIIQSEIAGIRKKLDFFIAQQQLSVQAILDFEKKYRQQVSHRHGYITPPNFDSARRLPIDELYVSPDFAVASSKNQAPEKEILNLQTFLTRIYRVVLLGNPGGGKSTLSHKVCHDIAEHYSQRLFAGREQLTPILVVLRNYGAEKKERRCSIREFIEAEIAGTYQLPAAPDGTLEYLLLNGRAIVIFDGLDELLETSYRQEIRDDVQSFCHLYPAVPVLVTSREVGYEQAPLDEAMFEVFRLEPFNNEQVKSYVQKWFAVADADITVKQRQQKIDAFLQESKSLTDLRSNPLMLALMCNIYRGENYLPRNRPDVYEKCATMLFERWDRGRNIRVLLPFETHIRPTMMYLANWIYADEVMRSGVSERKLVAKAAEYLQKKRFDDPDEAESAAREFIEFCRGRAWVFTDTGTEKDGERLYQFTHQTFLEYFAAWYLVRTHRTPASLITVLAPRIAKREWDVVAQLAFQMMNKNLEDAGDQLLSALMKRASKAKGDAYWNILSFAVRCLGFMVPTPGVTREIITTYMLSLVTVGAQLMKEKERFHSDALEGMDFLAPENYAIIVDTSERLFLEIIKENDPFKTCAILEICELLTRPYPGGIRAWNKVAAHVFDQCADKLEELLPCSHFLCERMFWKKKISIESVIRWHGVDRLFLSSIPSVLNIAYESTFDALKRNALYRAEGYTRYYADLLTSLENALLSLLPFTTIKSDYATQVQISRWLILRPLVRDQKMLDLDLDTLFGLFVIFAAALELCDSSKLPSVLETIKQAAHPFYTLIHYILLARFESVPDEKVWAEIDARGFSPEQQQFIWQWVRHEKNFIEHVNAETSTDKAVTS
jgi:hypothetical protein